MSTRELSDSFWMHFWIVHVQARAVGCWFHVVPKALAAFGCSCCVHRLECGSVPFMTDPMLWHKLQEGGQDDGDGYTGEKAHHKHREEGYGEDQTNEDTGRDQGYGVRLRIRCHLS